MYVCKSGRHVTIAIGSILGPLDFIIYVSDIPDSVPELSFILYADDTSAFTSNKDVSLLNNIISNGLNK